MKYIKYKQLLKSKRSEPLSILPFDLTSLLDHTIISPNLAEISIPCMQKLQKKSPTYAFDTLYYNSDWVEIDLYTSSKYNGRCNPQFDFYTIYEKSENTTRDSLRGKFL